MVASDLYGWTQRTMAERDSLQTYKNMKAEKGEAKLQVINQTFTPYSSLLFPQPEGAKRGLRILRGHLSKTLRILMK